VRFALVDAEKASYPIGLLCRTLGVSKSGYYAWRYRPPSARTQQDAGLSIEVAIAHRQSGCRYGSPRIHQELRANGSRIGRKRVERLMRQQHLLVRPKRRFQHTTDSKHTLPVAPNLVARNFSSDGPNKVWVGDITYVWTGEGWLYLSVLLDLFSRRVVGWALRDSLETGLALDALNMALRRRRPPPGLVHHTDRGCQYASHVYVCRLKESGAVPSMSRRGDCWDNAVAESFFATLKSELRPFTFDTPAAAATAIGDYIENFYNRRRRHSTIDYRSPVDFELRSQIASLAA
jgi:putative transposase